MATTTGSHLQHARRADVDAAADAAVAADAAADAAADTVEAERMSEVLDHDAPPKSLTETNPIAERAYRIEPDAPESANAAPRRQRERVRASTSTLLDEGLREGAARRTSGDPFQGRLASASPSGDEAVTLEAADVVVEPAPADDIELSYDLLEVAPSHAERRVEAALRRDGVPPASAPQWPAGAPAGHAPGRTSRRPTGPASRPLPTSLQGDTQGLPLQSEAHDAHQELRAGTQTFVDMSRAGFRRSREGASSSDGLQWLGIAIALVFLGLGAYIVLSSGG